MLTNSTPTSPSPPNSPEILVLTKFLPDLKTVSELNVREHWTAGNKRHTLQQASLRRAMPKDGYPNPCVVQFTRCGGRGLDPDNLSTAFKWMRDEMADIILGEFFGVCHKLKTKVNGRTVWQTPVKGSILPPVALKGRNDDNTQIEWRYAQQPKGIKGVRVDIFGYPDNLGDPDQLQST